jgi:hypothetical protein
MYKIIGADKKEYGPVTAEQLRQWIAEGRADGQTHVCAEGSTDWRPLSAFAEFAAALGPVTGAPGAPPPTAITDANALAAAILARDYRVDIGSCIGRAWQLVKENFWLLVGGLAITLVIMGCVGAVPFVGPVVGLVVDGALMGGLYLLFLKRIRGVQADVGGVFAGFSIAFAQLLLGHLVSTLLAGLGVLLCVVPGIYLGVSWVFTLPLIIDKKMDFWPAMELSRKVVTKHWWVIFGLMLVTFLLAAAGVLACIVGVFVTGSIATAAMMYAYEDIFGERAAQTA